MLSLLFATAGPQTHVAAAPRPLSATPAAISEALPPRAARGQPFNRRRRARPAPAPVALPMGDSAGAAPRPPAGYSSRGRRAARQSAEPAMATVREKAAALSLSAVCSPAARPPGTGGERGWGGAGRPQPGLGGDSW